MEERLWKIFNNVKSWLEFAERKNGYILTLLTIELALFKAFDLKIEGFLLISVIAFLVSLCIAVLSFYPEIKLTKFILDRLTGDLENPNDSDNLIFFGHIAKYSPDNFIPAMEKCLGESISNNKYLSDLCTQILVNSSIANEKFKTFKLSLIPMFVGQFFLIVHLFKVSS